jgi:hypothetical protein
MNSVPAEARQRSRRRSGLCGLRYLAISVLLASWSVAEGLLNMAGSIQGAKLLFSKPLVRRLQQRHVGGGMWGGVGWGGVGSERVYRHT